MRMTAGTYSATMILRPNIEKTNRHRRPISSLRLASLSNISPPADFIAIFILSAVVGLSGEIFQLLLLLSFSSSPALMLQHVSQSLALPIHSIISLKRIQSIKSPIKATGKQIKTRLTVPQMVWPSVINSTPLMASVITSPANRPVSDKDRCHKPGRQVLTHQKSI